MVQGPANFMKHGLYGQAWIDMHKIDPEQFSGRPLPRHTLVIQAHLALTQMVAQLALTQMVAHLALTPPHHLYLLHYIPPIPPEAVVKCVAMVLTLIPM